MNTQAPTSKGKASFVGRPLFLDVGTWSFTGAWSLVLGAFFSTAVAAFSSQASDWPQLLGPTRNGVYPGADLAANWPADGPRKLWQRNVGQGFSGPVVAGGRVVLFHRIDDKETVQSIDATSGKVVWTYEYPTAYRDDFGFDEGPRATPAIADGKIYTYGAEGALRCLDFAGNLLWQADMRTRFHAAKGFFGIACSPLVEGNALLLIVGGKDSAGIVAFDKNSGQVIWKITGDEASYSSPVAATIHNQRQVLCLTRSELVSAEPVTGKILWRFPFQPPIHASVSAATPLVIDDLVFVSACYDAGAALLKVNGATVGKVWAGDDFLSNHYATSVHHAGYLYGIHGRTDPGMEPRPSLRCIELKTGKVQWEEPSIGAATITLAGDQLLILTERGELIRGAASPARFKTSARAQILPNQVRAYPAIANSRLFARSKDKLVCVDLSGKP